MKTHIIYFGVAMLMLNSCKTEGNLNEEITRENIIIKGSDTEFLLVKELSDEFKENHDVDFDVTGEGSSKGIEALIANETSIANSSRKMSDDERISAMQNGVNPVQAIIAMDAVAFIAHPQNKVDSLSTLQLKGILSGDITNWKELGGEDHPINIYGRNQNSGTYRFLENRFVRDEGFDEAIQQMSSNQEILTAVENDPYGLGYVGVGFITDWNGKPNNSIWAMYLYTEGEDISYSPYESNAITNGDYPLVRPLYQYFNGVPAEMIREFLLFELSDDGQSIIRKNGFFPITEDYARENKANGIE
ncbi:MAG: PstS family phosphate ABC transporter substrate-binding protein [Crocinitomicaceae bacterium]|nr:PstS family phosphate ABC transporter substrate-binding protein [Crocinitomicaceae bacterium]MBK8925144.1 PstS family phosphate ABC transporter substrate-binding protein [Crocinitomicaceae bacterium]